ncbi:hypothetical protein CI109_105928 [Kwoniella shandongensis]|uniref:Uncharacterized protein n=1 Tax=Kwoniella shandongensis TaxID=1734106 RepID=A0AAJ8MZG8_9TREE
MLLTYPRSRLRTLFPLIFIGLLTYGLYNHYSSPTLAPRFDIHFEDPKPPLITLVALWSGDNFPNFAPYFFESVGRQPHALELVLIQRRGCSKDKIGQWTEGMTNVKHVCLSEQKFWKKHVDFFCKRWGGCTRQQGKLMLGDMINQGKLKNIQAVYPILRGWVFKEYIKPETAYWGYCDLDIFIGDISQTFPYDLARNGYDVIAPTEPSEEKGGDRLIFMRGHMTFFRNSPETLDRFMRYEYFQNFDAWDEMGAPVDSVDAMPNSEGGKAEDESITFPGEGEYSHFVVGDPRINILTFDGMAPYTVARSSSLAGVLTLSDHLRPKGDSPPAPLPPHVIRALTTPATKLLDKPSFTPAGVEYDVSVIQGHPPPGKGVWFPPDLASWYKAHPNPVGEHDHIGGGGKKRWRRYLMKYENEWKERLEPMPEFRGHYKDGGLDGTYQWLYIHWQEEKRQSHFRNLPKELTGDIFMNYFYDGNSIVDSRSGKRLVWLPRLRENCDSIGCVFPGEDPISSRPEHRKKVEAWLDYKDWYIDSIRLRKGIETGTLGPEPALPTNY